MRILLVDDHALFRSGMLHLLSEMDAAVEMVEAGSWDEAKAALQGQTYDLIITDLVMPGMKGDEAVSALRENAAETPIVVVSMIERNAEVRSAIAAGANGFIPKATSPDILLEALRIVMRGGTYLPPSLLNVDQDLPSENDRQNGVVRQLSRRQGQVLNELAQGKSNKEIAYSLGLSEATVKVHIAAIMRALKAQNRTQAVLAAVNGKLVSAA